MNDLDDLAFLHFHTKTRKGTPLAIASAKLPTQQKPTAKGLGLLAVAIATIVLFKREGRPSLYKSKSLFEKYWNFNTRNH